MTKIINSLMNSARALYVGNSLKNVYTTVLLPELKTVGSIIVSIATVAVLIYFIATAIGAGIKHQRGMEDDIPWRKLIVQFVCLVVGTTASSWMWGLIGQ